MITGQSFKPENDFALLLVGPPLSGKTTVAMQFPDPYIISTDRKLRNAVQRMPPDKKWWFNFVDDKRTPVENQWTRFTELTKQAAVSPDVKTIIWDNLTDLGHLIMAHMLHRDPPKLKVGGELVPELSYWQPFRNLYLKAHGLVRGCGKLFVVCAHEMVTEDEVAGTLHYRPLIGGQLKDSLGGYFTDVWRCETRMDPTGTKYFVRTQPTPRMSLGNSLGLPTEFVFTQDEFLKRLYGPPTPVQQPGPKPTITPGSGIPQAAK